MQVSKINTYAENNKYNKKSVQPNLNNNKASFKGGLGPIDTLSLGVANLIENGGLFVSFTLQDMLGTNLPRPFMGLRRNQKENKGKKNLSFAAKELTREMLTGPSMFLIPAGLLAIGKKAFGKTLEVPMNFIKSFGNIHAANPLTKEGNPISKTEFYQNTFTEIIKNAKSETEASEATINTAKEFAKSLSENIKDKATKKTTLSKLSDKFTDIVKNNAQNPAYTDFTEAVVSKTKPSSASFDKVTSYMMSYADDIVEKVKTQNPEKIKEYIEKTANKKVFGRLAAIATMFGAVLAFLQIIPKLYNKAEGKDNAGLKGLMKQETLQDENLNKTNDKQEKKEVKDKSKPSFGSSSAFVDKLTGNGTIGKLARGVEFNGCNVSFPLLLAFMAFGIMGPRVKNAKDKYDKEEIIRRDLVTCVVMCFAEKELRKGFSKLNETKSGLVLASKDAAFKEKNLPAKIFDYLRPINGVKVLSSSQIVSKYSGIDKYKDGVKGFCEFIEGQGGNLSKVFSLTEESKNIVNSLLEKEGKNIQNADNSAIKEILSKAKNSEEIKKLTDLFKDKNNPWVAKAKTLNARFTALSVLVLVPVFLGFMLPWINEKTTKKKYAEENSTNNTTVKDALPVQEAKKLDTEYAIKNDKNAPVFSDINNFVK